MAIRANDVMGQARKALAALQQHADVTGAFLFGSHVAGRADADSDIDLAVFVKGAETWGLRERADLAVLVQRESGDDIELHIFSDAQLEHCEPASFAAYVQKHGVRVDVAAVDRVAEEESEYDGRETPL